MDKVVAMCTTSNRFSDQIVDVHHDYAHDAEKGDAKAQACVNAIINSQVGLSTQKVWENLVLDRALLECQNGNLAPLCDGFSVCLDSQ